MASKFIVAVLDDDPVFLRDIETMLGQDFEIHPNDSPDTFLDSLSKAEPDLLLLDLDLGLREDGLSFYHRLRHEGWSFPVVLLSIHAGSRTTARALAEGVPYLNKDTDLDPKAFRKWVGLAIERYLTTIEAAYFRSRERFLELPDQAPWAASKLGTPVLGALRASIAGTGPVLLSGPCGTGKLTSARWLHQQRTPKALFLTVTARGRDPEAFERDLYGMEHPEFVEPGALAAAGVGTLYVEGLEFLPAPHLERLRAALASGTYQMIRSGKPRRIRCFVVVSLAADDLSEDWSDSLLGFWRSRSIILPKLRDHVEDLEFHARFIAALEGTPGKHGLGALSPKDLDRIRHLPFSANFNDLGLAVRFGVERLLAVASGTLRGPSGSRMIPASFLELGWTGAMTKLERALALAYYSLCKDDINCWRERSLLPPSTAYKKLAIAREALREDDP